VNRDLEAVELLGGTVSDKYRWDPITHTFVVVTGEDGHIEHTYSWGNSANTRGWNIDQKLDLRTAREALADKSAERVGGPRLDPFVAEAFSLINKKQNEHANGIVYCNCKTEAAGLIKDAKSLQILHGSRVHFDSVKINSNGSATGTYTPIGSRIARTMTCDSKGNCSETWTRTLV